MQMTACGRYCDVCKKNVIDFTHKSKDDYFALYEKDPQLCGRFRPEQVDLSLIAPIRFPFSKKVIIWFSGLLLTFGYKAASAQTDSILTEQVAPDPALASINGTIIVKKAAPVVEESAGTDRSAYYPPMVKPFWTTKKRMFYWSRRFPFISIQKRGQYRMGQAVRFL